MSADSPANDDQGMSQAEFDAAPAGGAGPSPDASVDPTPSAEKADAPTAETQATPTDSEGRPFDAAAMAEAIAEEKAAAAAAANAAPIVETTPFELPDFEAEAADAGARQGIELLHDVNLRVTVELGRTRMTVEDVLKLGDGSIVELDKLAGDPVDVMVNGRLVARGDVLVLNDTFSVRISEVVSAREQALASA
ncbi:MAG: flagellar motor switch protein FliN [Planctomycetes bacterium]|nr:flagellar motor switch protein FliN [Planctomycetota bacterium]